MGLLLAGLQSVPAAAESEGMRPERQLRVCADPNNLPFSNRRLEGFENRIAELIARELQASVQYTWWAQRRGFIRHTLRAGLCDVVLGVPHRFELTSTTRPYYRSSYVFVSRKDRGLTLRSLDDPVLHRLKIGVQLIGNDYANTPPPHALASRHLIDNVVGYTVYGDYAEENPPARIIEAVAAGDVDVAIVWGPLAGFFAARHSVPLEVVPVSPPHDLPFLPFSFAISLGVRKDDEAFRAELERVLERLQLEIEAILDAYAVPRVAAAPSPPTQGPYEESAYAIAHGQRLFEWFNCVGCHFHGGGGIGPPLMDDQWIYGSAPENIFASIVEGRPNGMPSFRGKIPEAQVWQLVAYVRALGGLVPKDAASGRSDHLSAKKPEQSQEAESPTAGGVPKTSEMPQ
jgi:quinoprotein dehydrogenase-associated probable ABC transporter substrate-binding protein